jgi:hypothetical protein
MDFVANFDVLIDKPAISIFKLNDNNLLLEKRRRKTI